MSKPINLIFNSEAEGDAYVAHLEKLLDAGIVPEEFKDKAKTVSTISQAIYQYIDAVHITDDDVAILGILNGQVGSRSLDQVNYQWAES